MAMVRLLLRLMALGCFVLTPGFYLLLQKHVHLTCDRGSGKCVLEERRPLRDPAIQTFLLPDVIDAACQNKDWAPSPEAATILKSARRPFNPGEAGVWHKVGETSGEEHPSFRVVLLTHGGIVPVSPHYDKDCKPEAITAVLSGHSAHGEMDEGKWWDGLAAAVLPAGTGLALLVWSFRIGKPR